MGEPCFESLPRGRITRGIFSAIFFGQFALKQKLCPKNWSERPYPPMPDHHHRPAGPAQKAKNGPKPLKLEQNVGEPCSEDLPRGRITRGIVSAIFYWPIRSKTKVMAEKLVRAALPTHAQSLSQAGQPKIAKNPPLVPPYPEKNKFSNFVLISVLLGVKSAQLSFAIVFSRF